MKRLNLVRIGILLLAVGWGVATARGGDSVNIVIITVDDMNCDSVGAYGCPVDDLTPHMDRLAAEGMRFDMAHVQVGNCYPSRNVMFSGRYPHTSGIEGFFQVRDIDFPVMCDVMQEAGYYVGIRGKVAHSTPYQPYHWDDDLSLNPDGKKEHIKDVPSYYRSTRRGIENAAQAGKPFVLNINISDPHKPFWKPDDPHPASRVITAEEVPIPGFLWEDEVVREELALYYTSVRRADDAVGAILQALDESGESDDTVVLFLSDHGMPLPFAKTQLYHHSTRTPLMVRWPGTVQPGAVDATNMVSAIDLLPTLCELAGTPIPAGVQGRSFVPLLRGESQSNRDFVIKEYNENSGRVRHPIRGIQTPEYLYLFNPWSDGNRAFKTATQGTATYRRMKELAATEPAIAARLDLFDHRVLEELYDVVNDPDCLNNLVDSPEHREELDSLRGKLVAWMKETEDPMLRAYELKDRPKELGVLIDREIEEGKARRASEKKKKRERSKKAKKSSG